MKKPFKVLIERQLILRNQDTHSKAKLRILIGIPRWTKKGKEAACPVAIEGWLGRVADIRGIDPLNAMEMALYFTNSLLKDFPPPKKLTWPNGDPYTGTYTDSSMVVSDALLRRQVKIQHELISKRMRQRKKGRG
jgi:hypothetical protein